MAKCEHCNKEFEVKPKTKGRFCTYGCYWDSLKDRKPKNMDGLKFGRGWNKGIFKEKAHYNSIHRWVQKNFIKADICELCQREDGKNYEWANISGKYRREKTDWMRLCVLCHRNYDLEHKKGIDYHGYY